MDALKEIRAKDPDVLMVCNSRTFSDLSVLEELMAASTGKAVGALFNVLKRYEEQGVDADFVRSTRDVYVGKFDMYSYHKQER